VKIVIAADHAAYEAKEQLESFLKALGHEVVDVGCNSSDRCDYPEFALAAIKMMKKTPDMKGILLCGSGVGMSMVANRFRGIRAALCRSAEEAITSREHNDSNVLCLGARITELDVIKEITQAWLSTEFVGGRHGASIIMFDKLGEK